MNITGNRLLEANRQQVWAALHDAEVLRSAITGCESMEWAADNELKAVMAAKIGPLKTKFKLKMIISNSVENRSYTLTCSADGGMAGNASGTADVTLDDVDGGCELTYQAHVKTTGKLATFGARLLQPASRKMIDSFFTDFAEQIDQRK